MNQLSFVARLCHVGRNFPYCHINLYVCAMYNVHCTILCTYRSIWLGGRGMLTSEILHTITVLVNDTGHRIFWVINNLYVFKSSYLTANLVRGDIVVRFLYWMCIDVHRIGCINVCELNILMWGYFTNVTSELFISSNYF